MHDHRWIDIKDAIREMGDADKLELIEHLTQSLRSQADERDPAIAANQQRQTFQQLQEKLTGVPQNHDPYADLGYSNKAHDQIIYDSNKP